VSSASPTAANCRYFLPLVLAAALSIGGGCASRKHDVASDSISADAPFSETAQTLANNTVEQNQKQQPSKDSARKPWYHFGWW
jgi:hypothetical protein